MASPSRDESRSDEEAMLLASLVLNVVIRGPLLRQGLPRRRSTQIPILIGIADEPITLVAFERLLLFLLLVMLPFHTPLLASEETPK